MIGGGHQQQPPPQAPPQVVYHIAGGGGGGGGMSQHQQAAAVAAAAAAAAQQQQQQHLLLHQGFLLTPQPYSIQLSHTSGGLVEELIKLSPPPPPGSPSSSGGGAPSSNSPSAQERFALLAMLEHKVEQLQSVVRCMSQGGQHSGGLVQPQSAMAAARLASSISQLALATLGAAAPPPPPQFFVPHEHHPQFGGFQPPPLQPQQAPPPQGMLSLFHQFSQPPLLAPIPIPAVPPPPPAAAPPEAPAPAPPPPPPPPAAAAAAQEDNNGAMEEGGGDSGGGDEEPEAEGDGEELTPGSYDLVEMNAVEILAEHTHFCDKCGKGFKRDANLRMHMRGHGEQYKSPAALARPSAAEGGNPSTTAGERPRRYSCPYVGCKRNKRHRKFQPLKTVLCVKNHYRRSHCPKSLTCGKCKSKKFSVVADLKTHEKHCGRDKWQCSCGTTFSRKDKLIGHIGLFQGHTPAIPLEEQHSSSSSKQAAAVAVAAAAAAAADGDATPTPPVAAAG